MTAPKARLRGVSHQVAFVCAGVATAALLVVARRGPQSLSALVFGASLVVLFGVSALYHRIEWGPRALRWMRRFDHSAVLLAIAGGHTPLFALVPSSTGGHRALAVVWLGAGAGVIRAVTWPDAPRWVTAAISATAGWLTVGQVLDRVSSAGGAAIATFVTSGVLYTLGAIVYATRRPDPVPDVFGYHEVFHALVVVGTAILFVHAVLVLRST